MKAQQLDLLTSPLPADPPVIVVDRPWKIVRHASKAVYARMRDSGRTARSTLRVLTALAWYRNSFQTWPTASELTEFMYRRRRLVRNETRHVAPRLTELVRGSVRTRKDGTKVRAGGGLLVYLPLRRCAITGESVHPVAIREAGSLTAEVMRWPYVVASPTVH